MLQTVFLLDVTRHTGPAQSLVGPALAYVSSVDPDAVIWWVLSSRQSGFGNDPSHQIRSNNTGVRLWPEISRLIQDVRQNSSSSNYRFRLITYDNGLIAVAHELKAQINLEVNHWTICLGKNRREFRPYGLPPLKAEPAGSGVKPEPAAPSGPPAQAQPTVSQSETPKPTDKGRQRTQRFKECLKDSHLYSNGAARVQLLSAVEGLLAKGGAPVRQLFRTAGMQVKPAAFGIPEKHWFAVVDSVRRAALGADALLGEGMTPISSKSQTRANGTVAVGLCKDYHDQVDAFLIEYLISHVGDVTDRDITSIAYAVLDGLGEPDGDDVSRRFMLEDRVQHLLTRMGDLLEERDDGALRVRPRLAPVEASVA